MHTFFSKQNNINTDLPASWVETFEQLPQQLQRAFPLLAFWGLSVDQVSELLGVPPKTLTKALSSVLVMKNPVVKNHGA